MITLPSPNTSWSPASLVIVADGPNAGVPQQQAPVMADQVAVVRELDRLALVDAGRPARLVLADVAPAVEHVEALHPGARHAGEQAHQSRHHHENAAGHWAPPGRDG